jgi:hypothetical protein
LDDYGFIQKYAGVNMKTKEQMIEDGWMAMVESSFDEKLDGAVKGIAWIVLAIFMAFIACIVSLVLLELVV